jgi:hypothetical protein
LFLLARHEMVGLKLIADFQHALGIDPELRHLAAGLDLGLGKLAALGLVGVLRLGKARAELNGGIAVLLLGLDRRDGAAVQLEDGDRNMRAVCQEQTGHAHFLRDDACAHLTLLTT